MRPAKGECIFFKPVYIFEFCVMDNILVIKSRRLRWAGHVARIGERRSAYRASVRKPEGRRPLERPRLKLEDNIKMDLREVGWGAWTGLIWLRIGTGGGLLCIRW
jgi:hypothetical protein